MSFSNVVPRDIDVARYQCWSLIKSQSLIGERERLYETYEETVEWIRARVNPLPSSDAYNRPCSRRDASCDRAAD